MMFQMMFQKVIHVIYIHSYIHSICFETLQTPLIKWIKKSEGEFWDVNLAKKRLNKSVCHVFFLSKI